MASNESQIKFRTNEKPFKLIDYLETLDFYFDSPDVSQPNFGKQFLLCPKYIILRNQYKEDGITKFMEILLPYFIDQINILQIGEKNSMKNFGNCRNFFFEIRKNRGLIQEKKFYQYYYDGALNTEKFLNTLPFYSESLLSNFIFQTKKERVYIFFPQKISVYKNDGEKNCSFPYLIIKNGNIFINSSTRGNYKTYLQNLKKTKELKQNYKNFRPYDIKALNREKYFKTLYFYSEDLTLKDEIQTLETKIFALFPQEIYLFDINSSLKEKSLSQYIDDNDILQIDKKDCGNYKDFLDNIYNQETLFWGNEIYKAYNFKDAERKKYFNTLKFYSESLKQDDEIETKQKKFFIFFFDKIYLFDKDSTQKSKYLRQAIDDNDELWLEGKLLKNYKIFFDIIKMGKCTCNGQSDNTCQEKEFEKYGFTCEKGNYKALDIKAIERKKYIQKFPFYCEKFYPHFGMPEKTFILQSNNIYLFDKKNSTRSISLSQSIDKDNNFIIEDEKNCGYYKSFLKSIKKTFTWGGETYRTYNPIEFEHEEFLKEFSFYFESLIEESELKRQEANVFVVLPETIYLFNKNFPLKSKYLSYSIDDDDKLTINNEEKFGNYENFFNDIEKNNFTWEDETYTAYDPSKETIIFY